MKNIPSALILMSTYNGEKFLKAQLDSILSQTFSDWTLLIRDDGSSDDTKSIIRHYSSLDSRIILQEDTLGNLGIIKSFSTLMLAASERKEPYLFFCDQDDVWLPHKVSITLQQLRQIEEKNGMHIPALTHTDLRVVDSQLNTIHPSYRQFERLKHNINHPLRTLLINNYITGCTIGMNRALLHLATPIPDAARMHDWWCGLCAASNGVIQYINEPTILYRQHKQNAIGSKNIYAKLWEHTSIKKLYAEQTTRLSSCFRQASMLIHRAPSDSRHFSYLSDFVSIPTLKPISRYIKALKLGIRPVNNFRFTAFYVFLAFI